MLYEHSIWGLYQKVKVTLLICSNDVWLDPFKSRWCMSLDPNDAWLIQTGVSGEFPWSADMCHICVFLKSGEFHWLKVLSWGVELLLEWVADKRCRCFLEYWVLLQVLTIFGLELRASIEERIIVDVCISSVWWTTSIVSPYFLVIHVLWSSKSGVWGMLLITGCNNTDSLFSHVVLMSVMMHAMLDRRWVQVFLQVDYVQE